MSATTAAPSSTADPTGALRRLILAGEGPAVLFGVTPPRRSTEADRVAQIAHRTVERLDGMDVDGLVLYDINDEGDRNDDPRPFPYVATMDPDVYRGEYLMDYPQPAVVYRCVGKYSEAQLRDWITRQGDDAMTVFVGASSADRPVATSLARAMQIRRETRPGLLLGGVAIPERHRSHGDEHLRLLRKQRDGCSFFITQVVYDMTAAKDLVSDYFYACEDEGVRPAPLIFTLSLCGSEKTLEFLQWLGVSVPSWVQNELRRHKDTLEVSRGHCIAVARELSTFCRELGMPFGFNVESVSSRRAEIDAAVDLVTHVKAIVGR